MLNIRICRAYVFNILNSTTGIRTEDQSSSGPDPCAYAIINKDRDQWGLELPSPSTEMAIVAGNPWAYITTTAAR